MKHTCCLTIRCGTRSPVVMCEVKTLDFDGYLTHLVERTSDSRRVLSIGFIDLLRKRERLVGIGFTPPDEFDWVLSFDSADNVDVEGGSMLVFFDDSQAFDRRSSCDQLMLPTRVFGSVAEQEFVLVIEITDDDLSARALPSARGKYLIATDDVF